ncbi:MAG: hypothetical protein GF398_17545 [Chitinivibrionales bacterium]|nr:hypothetical protein [Chitinivibrionales bacterium]
MNILPTNIIRKRQAAFLLLIVPVLHVWAQPDTASAPDNPLQPVRKEVATADTLFEDSIVIEDTTEEAALKDTVRYTADVIDYDLENKVLYLIGNGSIHYQNLILFADTITYIIEEDIFKARGKPMLVEGNDTTIGESMRYNIDTRRGSVTYASTRMNGDFFNGRQIVKTKENEFYAADADYTTCTYVDSPHYYFYARDIKVIPDDKAVARPAVFNIAEVPVGVLPYFIFPIDRDRTSGWLTPGFGGNPGSGGYLDNVGYYWAINEYADFLTASRIEEFQNYLIRASSRYKLRHWFDGSIGSQLAYRGGFERRSREWSLNYRHQQKITPDNNLNLSGSGTILSNKDFFVRNSDEDDEILRQQTDANLTLHKNFARIGASANATWSQSQNLTTGVITRDEPRMNFSLRDRAVLPEKDNEEKLSAPEQQEPAWYHNFRYSYNAAANNRYFTNPEIRDSDPWWQYTRKGVSQNARLYYRGKLFKHISVDPFIDVRSVYFDWYKDTLSKDTSVSTDTLLDTVRAFELDERRAQGDSIFREIDTLDSLGFADTLYVLIDSTIDDTLINDLAMHEGDLDYDWSTGVSLRTQLFGKFPIKLFNFQGLKHELRPGMTFSYAPVHEQDKRYFPVGISPLGPRDSSTLSTNFTLGNDFFGKALVKPKKEGPKPEEAKFHLLNFSLSTSYNYKFRDFDNLIATGNGRWSNLGVRAGNSNKFVRISYSSTYWLYDEFDNLLLPDRQPALANYSVTVSPAIGLAAKGAFWGGDYIVHNDAHPEDDPAEYQRAGPQAWSASIQPNYSFSKSRSSLLEPFTTQKSYQLSANARINFTRKWSLAWDGRWDFRENRLLSGTLNFYCDLECWDLRFRWRPPGGFNPGYYFLVRIKKIPEVKWEKQD